MPALVAVLIEAFGPEVLALIGLAIVIPLMNLIRGIIQAIPFIGTQLANALGGVWNWFAGVIQSMERTVEYTTNTILQVVGHAAIYVLGAAIDYALSLANSAHSLISLLFNDISGIWNAIYGWVNAAIIAAHSLAQAAYGLANSAWIAAGTALSRIGAAEVNIAWLLLHFVPGVNARLSALEAVAAEVPVMLRDLSGLKGLTAQQAADIAALTVAVKSIDTTIGIDGREIGTLAGQLAQVLPLSVIAALGLTAIDTLVKVAEDPCYCMSSTGNLSDLTSRVLALENSQ